MPQHFDVRPEVNLVFLFVFAVFLAAVAVIRFSRQFPHKSSFGVVTVDFDGHLHIFVKENVNLFVQSLRIIQKARRFVSFFSEPDTMNDGEVGDVQSVPGQFNKKMVAGFPIHCNESKINQH